MKNNNMNIKTIWLLEMIIVLLIFIVVLIIINSLNKTLSIKEFENIMTKEGLLTQNVKDQFTEEYVKDAVVAYNKYDTYQIEYVIFTDNESAKNAFNINKNDFLSKKTSDAMEEINTSKDNKSVYSLTTDDKYMYVSRKDNTLIYVNVDGSYKITVANIVAKINY